MKRLAVIVLALLAACAPAALPAIPTVAGNTPFEQPVDLPNSTIPPIDDCIYFGDECLQFPDTTPTLTEFIRFVNADDTDKRPYVEGKYNCWDFAYDFMKRATNFDVQMIRVDFNDGSYHVFDVVNLAGGPVFFEPQRDTFYQPPLVGQRLYNSDGSFNFLPRIAAVYEIEP
jgi:hypothetical protein